MDETTKLELGHFAELARMLKYVDRHDEEEIMATIKLEGEKEMQKAQEHLETVNELIAETTGETVENHGVETQNEEHDEGSQGQETPQIS
jgi:hypothetical protein